MTIHLEAGTLFFHMTLEEKLTAYRELCRKLQQLEEEKKALAQIILKEMPDKKWAFSDCIARVYTRLFVRTPLEQARMFDATKMVEQVDKDRLKAIYKSGVPLDGIEEVSYLVISSPKPPSSSQTEDETASR